MSTIVNEEGIVIEDEDEYEEMISELLGSIMQIFVILLIDHLDKEGLKNDLRQYVTDIASKYDIDVNVTSEKMDRFVDRILYEKIVPEAIRKECDENEEFYDPITSDVIEEALIDQYEKDSAKEME